MNDTDSSRCFSLCHTRVVSITQYLRRIREGERNTHNDQQPNMTNFFLVSVSVSFWDPLREVSAGADMVVTPGSMAADEGGGAGAGAIGVSAKSGGGVTRPFHCTHATSSLHSRGHSFGAYLINARSRDWGMIWVDVSTREMFRREFFRSFLHANRRCL